MNLWARMLAELPATGQRAIARHQRISLPRGCDAVTRQLRLRQALCHAATVRVVYANLPPAVQDALQHLRSLHGGISPADLIRHYGALRSWRDLAADPRPRTISEQLVLLGWLLPRPIAHRHPQRYLAPPELRHWLPEPLPQPLAPLSPPNAHLPALRATATLLLACAEQPQAIIQAGTLRRAALCQITPRLTPFDADTGGILTNGSAALLDWLLPLLSALDLISCHQGCATITLAGQRFLALPPEQQQAQLRDAWLRAPAPDAWLLRLRIDPRGIDWPLLRRRLCTWARAIPADDPRDPATRYAQLARSFGPLADAQTHGFRAVDRAPWQPRRAAAVLDAALHGPLAWLGLVGTAAPSDAPMPATESRRMEGPTALALPIIVPHQQHRMRNPPRSAGCRHRRPSRWRWPDADDDTAATEPTHTVEDERPVAHPSMSVADQRDDQPASPARGSRWRYHAPGVIAVPHAAPQTATLRLLPFARWDGVDADATYYRITAASLARALSQGESAAECRQLLDRQAGPPPEGWCAALDAPPTMRLVQTGVLLVDTPALLERAGRARSVRRYLKQRIAPGIALVRPEDRAPLVRSLERQGIPCTVEGADTEGQAPPMDGLRGRTADIRGSAATVRVRSHATASPHRAEEPAPPNLSPGERAALLIACAHYRQHAPAAAPLLPHVALEARLRAGLSPTLQSAVDRALADLRPPPTESRRTEGSAVAPAARPPLERTIHTLRAALARQRPVDLTYDTAGQGALNTRTVRPLALEQRDDTWYLRAYCTTRQAERTFRVDRIMAIADCRLRTG